MPADIARRHPAWLLLGLGALSAAVEALIFASRYPLTRYYDVPLIQFGIHVVSHPQLWIVGAWSSLFALYYLAYRAVPVTGSRALVIVVCGVSVGLAAIYLTIYPIASSDVYDYAVRAQLLVAHHANPFTMLPGQFKSDPLNKYIYWQQVPAFYGPLWHVQADALAMLLGRRLLASIVAFKLLVTLYYLAGLPLVYLIVNRLRPEHVVRALVLYGWNPLLQFEFAGNGHNDAVCLFFMLAGFLLFMRGSQALAFGALTAGILVKFVPLLLLPVFVAAVLKDPRLPRRAQLLSLAAGAALSVVLALASYAPYGPRSVVDSVVQLSKRETHFGNSLPGFFVYLLNDGLGVERARAVSAVGALGKLVVLAFICWQVVRILRSSQMTAEELSMRVARSGFEILFLFLLVGVLWIWPWYLSWLFAFVPALAAPGYAARAAVFSLSVLGIYVMIYFLGAYLLVTVKLAEIPRSGLLVLIAFLPPVAATLLLRARLRGPGSGESPSSRRVATAEL